MTREALETARKGILAVVENNLMALEDEDNWSKTNIEAATNEIFDELLSLLEKTPD